MAKAFKAIEKFNKKHGVMPTPEGVANPTAMLRANSSLPQKKQATGKSFVYSFFDGVLSDFEGLAKW